MHIHRPVHSSYKQNSELWVCFALLGSKCTSWLLPSAFLGRKSGIMGTSRLRRGALRFGQSPVMEPGVLLSVSLILISSLHQLINLEQRCSPQLGQQRSSLGMWSCVIWNKVTLSDSSSLFSLISVLHALGMKVYSLSCPALKLLWSYFSRFFFPKPLIKKGWFLSVEKCSAFAAYFQKTQKRTP